MHSLHTRALRGAIVLTVVATACQDAPFEPHASRSAPSAIAPVTAVRVRAFSGRAGDSVMNVLEAAWARHGRPEYGQARLAWRARNGVPAQIGDSFAAPPVLVPNAVLVASTDVVTKPAPKVITHYEAMRFGYSNAYGNVPSGVEGEMTFIGDNGDINAGLTVTAKSGATYTVAGKIATGPGNLVNCTDLSSTDCENRRHLSGVLTMAVPNCDASGGGSVSYTAANVSSSVSGVSFGTTGSADASFVSVAQVSSTAGLCILDTGDQGGLPGTDDPPPPTGNPAQPDPDPTPWASDPYEPQPPALGAPPVVFWCYSVTANQIVGDMHLLLYTVDYCVPG